MIADFLSSLVPGRRAVDFGPLSDFWYNPVGSASSAGIAVKPDNAMAVSAVFACIHKLSEVLGQLDFMVYDESGGKKAVAARDHQLWPTLYRKPNRWQTPIEWQAMGMAHLCLRGNFICQIIDSPALRDGDPTIELVPLNPDRIKPKLLPNRTVEYTYTPTAGERVVFDAAQVLHVRGLSLDGVNGVSVLEYARHAVGSAIAQETHGASLFKNGGLPTFWLGMPPGKKMMGEARRNFRAGWRKLHGGAENAGNPPILEDGMEVHELSLTNRDSQWLEARGFQAEEICRFFGVPPYMIGIRGEAARTIEQMGTEFVRYTLAPWSVRWCQAMQRDLIDEPQRYSIRQNLEELEKGDKLSRYQAKNIGIQGGWLLPNEARAEEGLEPIEGGDTPRFPMNMQPAGGGPDEGEQGGQPGKGKPKEKTPAAPTEEDDTEEQTPREKKKADQKARRKDKAKRAFSALLADAAGRIASAEIRGLEPLAKKASTNHAKWCDFAKEAYCHHRDYIIKTLTPIAAAWRLWTESDVSSESAACDLCGITGDCVSAAVAPVFDLIADKSALLNEWKNTRAQAVLAILERAFFDEAL